MALPKLEGLIRISESTTVGTITVAATPYVVTLAVGEYFLTTGYSGANGLLATLKTAIQTAVGSGTATLTVSDDADTSTGLVTIQFSSSFTFSWTSTYLRDLLGFTGTLTPAATSFTGTAQAQTLWLPNCGRSNVMAPEAADGAIESDYTCSTSPSGASAVMAYTARYVDTMEFAHVSGSKAWTTHEVTTNESFQSFYEDTIAVGCPVRYYKDRSSDSTYRTWVVKNGGQYKPAQVFANWVGSKSLWSFSYEVMKDVS